MMPSQGGARRRGASDNKATGKTASTERARRPRIVCIDAVRGLVMVLMALDHVRLFFHAGSLLDSPTNLDRTTTAVFLTRWVTHLCAPTFIFLAGMGAFLRSQGSPSRAAAARFLCLRGLWLILLELTAVHFLWHFNFSYREVDGGVLWAIGWSMIALGGLLFLPRRVVGPLAVTLIAAQHLWQSTESNAWGAWSWLWAILYSCDTLGPWRGIQFDPVYPLIPWVGVLAAGWVCGPWMLLARETRRRRLLLAGSILLVAFVFLRLLNVYGDPQPWSVRDGHWSTVLSFVHCTKYPPSLAFLLMTLGPCLLLLAWLDRPSGMVSGKLSIFGRAPLFFYLLHLFVIHALAVVFSLARYGRASWLFEYPSWNKDYADVYPEGYGYSLLVVYLVWVLVLAILYPCCRWYCAKRKRGTP
ncbi:MAG: heparan-alpha-glucosaminide N-acetyltransferase domain-containing protein [Thermoguttaceae bacterium]|jgi:uncharacterized membrane protein